MYNKKVKFEVYTDAASYNNGLRNSSENQYTESVAILVFEGKILQIFKSFNIDSTNNHGEIYAIFLGLKKTMKILEKIDVLGPPYNIDLYSDSEISVKGLTEWLGGWKQRADSQGNLYSTNGLVANQSVIKKIDSKFLQNFDLNLNIYHIRGHIDINSKKSLSKCIETFKRNNGFLPSFGKLMFIIAMNNICDRCAVKYLKEDMEKNAK